MAANSRAGADKQRVIDLVEAALALPEDQRLAYLDQACIDAPKLRRWAESLLPSELQTTGLLPRNPDAEIELPEPVGASLTAVPPFIGPYRLVEVLGEGGMGTVYLAEQTEPIRRQVAVKVTRARPDQRKLMHRFEVERQALARMSHPSIAQVFEAGDLPDGRPYYVMEHVPGVSLLRFCDRGHLSIERRLDLFLDVCAGIHHAHQKGVLHRDIKPENVLVTEQGGLAVPKIIDFGIAKTLDASVADPTLLTGDVLLGTPAFVSPELFSDNKHLQAEADVRSDVYALGVLLYILLVGELPFERQEESVLGFMRRMSEFDAPAPSARLAALPSQARWELALQRDATPLSLGRRLQGDLDRIVLKAIARKRDNRYSSAIELADDLRRHLADEPVGARAVPRHSSFRWLKRLRRYPLAAAALLMLVSGLLGALVVNSFHRRDTPSRANHIATRNAETEATVRYLLDVLEARPKEPSAQPADETLRRLLATDIPGLPPGSGGDGSADPGVDPALQVRMLVTLGELCNQAGLPERAEQLLERAHQLSTELPEVGDEQRTRLREALADSRRQRGQTVESQPLHRRAYDSTSSRRQALPSSLLPELPPSETQLRGGLIAD